MKDSFSKLHPVVQLLFFTFTFVLDMCVQNPIFSAIALLCAVLYVARLKKGTVLSSIKFVFAMVVVVSVFNMLFSHYGENVLFTIKNTQFTLEALFYGFNQGLVLGAVILWFSAFSRIIDSERVVYLFRFTPKIATIFSMVLGFIPRFAQKLKDIDEANLCLNNGKKPSNFKQKFKVSLHNFSALVTYSLESSIVTANSMSARGYNPRAIRAGRFKYSFTDFVLILLVLALSFVVLFEKLRGNIDFVFEPIIYIETLSPFAVVAFGAFQLIPIVVDLYEDLLWKLSGAKI